MSLHVFVDGPDSQDPDSPLGFLFAKPPLAFWCPLNSAAIFLFEQLPTLPSCFSAESSDRFESDLLKLCETPKPFFAHFSFLPGDSMRAVQRGLGFAQIIS